MSSAVLRRALPPSARARVRGCGAGLACLLVAPATADMRRTRSARGSRTARDRCCGTPSGTAATTRAGYSVSSRRSPGSSARARSARSPVCTLLVFAGWPRAPRAPRRPARVATWLFASGVVTNVVIGRMPFTLGIASPSPRGPCAVRSAVGGGLRAAPARPRRARRRAGRRGRRRRIGPDAHADRRRSLAPRPSSSRGLRARARGHRQPRPGGVGHGRRRARLRRHLGKPGGRRVPLHRRARAGAGRRARRARPRGGARGSGVPGRARDRRRLPRGRDGPLRRRPRSGRCSRCASAHAHARPHRRAVRVAAVVYLVLLFGAFVLPTPLGPERAAAGVLLGPSLLALCPRPRAPRVLLVLAIGLLVYLQWLPAVRAVTEAIGRPGDQGGVLHAAVASSTRWRGRATASRCR